MPLGLSLRPRKGARLAGRGATPLSRGVQSLPVTTGRSLDCRCRRGRLGQRLCDAALCVNMSCVCLQVRWRQHIAASSRRLGGQSSPGETPGYPGEARRVTTSDRDAGSAPLHNGYARPATVTLPELAGHAPADGPIMYV